MRTYKYSADSRLREPPARGEERVLRLAGRRDVPQHQRHRPALRAGRGPRARHAGQAQGCPGAGDRRATAQLVDKLRIPPAAPAHRRRHCTPDRCLGHPASPQPGRRTRREHGPAALLDPRPRQQVHRGLRRSVSRRGYRDHQDTGPRAEGRRPLRASDRHPPPRSPRSRADPGRSSRAPGPCRVREAPPRASHPPGVKPVVSRSPRTTAAGPCLGRPQSPAHPHPRRRDQRVQVRRLTSSDDYSSPTVSRKACGQSSG